MGKSGHPVGEHDIWRLDGEKGPNFVDPHRKTLYKGEFSKEHDLKQGPWYQYRTQDGNKNQGLPEPFLILGEDRENQVKTEANDHGEKCTQALTKKVASTGIMTIKKKRKSSDDQSNDHKIDIRQDFNREFAPLDQVGDEPEQHQQRQRNR